MRKLYILLLLGIVILPAVMAVNLDVKGISDNEAIVIGLKAPAQFTVEVTNNGPADTLSFYTFFGEGISPMEGYAFDQGETKKIIFDVYPRIDLYTKGYTTFSYFIQGKDKTEIEEKLTVNVVELKDAFNIRASPINPESDTIKIFIENKLNFNFEGLDVKLSSPFFDLEKKISLGPYETKSFEANLDKADFDKLIAGFYTLHSNINIKNVSANTEGKIEFVKNDLLKTTSNTYGFIVSTKIIRKVNEGNTVSESETIIKKNIISRLFTTFSSQPDSVERKGSSIYYTWAQKISPGNSSEIIVKTNWFIPFLIVLLVISTIYFVKKYSNQKLVLRKKVSFVKAKGGEFALKVTIIAEAREFVERIKVIDRLPPLVKMYERFGGELPDKITKDKKRLEWDFNYLDAGEKRVMSYIVYSKLGILGKFALPGVIARFEKNGKRKQTSSNKAYFLVDQKSRNKI